MPTEILKRSIVTDIETNLVIKGERETTKGLNDYEKAIDSAKGKVKQHSAEVGKAEINAKKFADSNIKVSDVLGKIGDTVGQVNPRIGSMIQTFSNLTTSVGNFATKAGSGISNFSGSILRLLPALGGVAAAIGAVVGVSLLSYFTQSGEGADLLDRKIRRLKQAGDDLLDNFGEIGRLLVSGEFAKAFSFNRFGGSGDSDKALNGEIAEQNELRKQQLQELKRINSSILIDLEKEVSLNRLIFTEEASTFAEKQAALDIIKAKEAEISAIKRNEAVVFADIIREENSLRGQSLTSLEKQTQTAADNAIKQIDIRQDAEERASEKNQKLLNRQKAASQKHYEDLLEQRKQFLQKIERGEIDAILGRIVTPNQPLSFEAKEAINRTIDDLIAELRSQAKLLQGEGIPFKVNPEIAIKDLEALLKDQLAKVPPIEVDVLVSTKLAKDLPLPGIAQPGSTGKSRFDEAKELEKIEDERRKKLREDEIKVLEGFANVAKAFAAAEVEKTDRLIEEQQRRIDGVKEIAEKGNAEQLQLEEERLTKLLQKRESAVKRQETLNKIEAASQAALNIVTLIGGIAKEAGTTSIYSAIIGGIALVATIGGLIASLKSTQGFAGGIEYVTGPGTSKSDSIPANLSVGERIVPEWINKQLGVPNIKLPYYVNIGKMVEETASKKINYPKNTDSTDNALLNKILGIAEQSNKKVDDLQVFVQFDENSMIVRNERRHKHEIIKQRLTR